MANLNRVTLIGRLTRDPEVRSFANGGKVAKFGFAVNNRKKNQQSGQWEDEPVFLNCEAFNRGDSGTLADRIERSSKGSQLYIEGHLQLDQWTTQQGEKRSQLKIVVDSIQNLETNQEANQGHRFGDEPQRSWGNSRPSGNSRYQDTAPPSRTPPRGNFAPEGDLPF